jgi:hypothetical protein
MIVRLREVILRKVGAGKFVWCGVRGSAPHQNLRCQICQKNGDSERYSPDCMDSMDFMEIAQVTLESME